ncbi:MAG: hypothetical protein Q4P23_07020 [Micrococcaceae bacterium]|nr:hypothetical protein [Micrococcaceae bacterium]
MPSQPNSLPRWVHSFALLRDRTVTRDEAGLLQSVATDESDNEVTCSWPESESLASLLADPGLANGPGQTMLTLLGTPDEAVIGALQEQGWSRKGNRVLLAALTNDVDQEIRLPETATLFEAPMENYDVVEIADFDAPAGRGRIRFAEGFALLGDPNIMAPTNAGQFRAAILANLAAAATRQGLPVLFMVTNADTATGTRVERANGWSNATQLTTFAKA